MLLEIATNPLLAWGCVRTYKSNLGGIALNALLLLVLRPFASTRFLRRILGIGSSYIFSLVNAGTVGGSIRIVSSSTSISNAMFLNTLLQKIICNITTFF
jgi:hypothetical protein